MTDSESYIRPGEKALIAMKNLKTEGVFKVPALPAIRKPNKVKVLDEDTYAEELGKIIQRDFFPDVQEIMARYAELKAMDKATVKLLKKPLVTISLSNPPSERGTSPATFDTPHGQDQTTPRTDWNFSPGSQKSSGSKSSKKYNPKLTLDEFLSIHTSEDNMSFQDIMEVAELKMRQKFAALYGIEDQNEQILHNMLTVPSMEDQCDQTDRPKNIDTWTYKNKNYIMYVPDGVELRQDEKIEMAKQKQQICHANTRLSVNPFDDLQSKETISEIAKSQARILDGRIGVDGNTVIHATPNVKGYGFVRTPSPSPSVMGTPLMTWGHIDGTPSRLDGGNTPILRFGTGSAFKIAKTPRREQIAIELAEKAGKRHRDLKQKTLDARKRHMTSPSPRPASSLERLASMSPAARRLASSKITGHMGSLGIRTYTPSPSRSPSLVLKSKTPNALLKMKTTPNRNRKRTPKIISADGKIDSVSTKNTILTDDLLNINVPKRKTAMDFF